MEATLTIQDFNALLLRGQESDWLVQLLRALTTLEGPEEVKRILKWEEPGARWGGWG